MHTVAVVSYLHRKDGLTGFGTHRGKDFDTVELLFGRLNSSKLLVFFPFNNFFSYIFVLYACNVMYIFSWFLVKVGEISPL